MCDDLHRIDMALHLQHFMYNRTPTKRWLEMIVGLVMIQFIYMHALVIQVTYMKYIFGEFSDIDNLWKCYSSQ